MTGYLSEVGDAPISILSVRAFADLGYSVDVSKADRFRLSKDAHHRLRGSSTAVNSTPSPTNGEISYGDDVLNLPMTILPSNIKLSTSR